MSEQFVLLGIIIAALSGVPGLFISRTSNVGQWLSMLLTVVSSVCGLAGVSVFWATGISAPIVRPWLVPGAEFYVAMDGLSALFLTPIFVISALGSIYGLGYWNQAYHTQNGRRLHLFYGFLPAGMALLVMARNSILFLVGWEIMALSAFFLVTTEDDDSGVRFTGWVYLVSTKFATVSLFALFALLRAASGSFSLIPLKDGALPHGMLMAIFTFTIVGFGLKAGLMPFHVWLPNAHASAPSHVSAMMSGVMIKMGIYGIVRVMSLIPHPPVEYGAILLGLGAVSGALGIAFSVGQRDLKRLLAYSSIENMGIIAIGIGLALLGRSLGRIDLVILGMSGAMLHVWNHALFKSLLFLNAGSIIHGTDTREIDWMGGLAKRMPHTATCFLIGALAVCGLPPLNGFVSEFLIYLAAFKSLKVDGAQSLGIAALAAPVLALIGALAVACFVKAFGIVFLGAARTKHSSDACESPPSMIVPMYVLGTCCLIIGLAPVLVAPIIAQAIADSAPEINDVASKLTELAPLYWIMTMEIVLTSALLITGLLLWIRLQRTGVEFGPTWGCGFAAPTPRIQYTSSSFAELLVGLFAWALRPQSKRPKLSSLFPQKADFQSEIHDPVLDQTVLPMFHFAAEKFSWFRVFQRGKIEVYLIYLFGTLVALLLW